MEEINKLSKSTEIAAANMKKLSGGISEVLGGKSSFAGGFFGSLETSYGSGLKNVLDQQEKDKQRRIDATAKPGTSAEDAGSQINEQAKGVANAQQQNDKARVDSDKNAWGSMVANALAGSKKLRKIHQALAIATTITNTAKGVMSALSGPPDGPPFPLNLAQAAFVAAMGAKQIASIKGQAHDGLSSIPSTGTYLLEQGERVVGSRLNQDLSEYLSLQKSGAEGTGATHNSVTNAPVINLSLGADADENTVNQNRGAMETIIREIFADYGMNAPFA